MQAWNRQVKALPGKELLHRCLSGDMFRPHFSVFILFFFSVSSSSPFLFPFWCVLSPDPSVCLASALWLFVSLSLSFCL